MTERLPRVLLSGHTSKQKIRFFSLSRQAFVAGLFPLNTIGLVCCAYQNIASCKSQHRHISFTVAFFPRSIRSRTKNFNFVATYQKSLFVRCFPHIREMHEARDHSAIYRSIVTKRHNLIARTDMFGCVSTTSYFLVVRKILYEWGGSTQ